MMSSLVNQEEFESKIKNFDELEDARGQIAKMASNLIEKGFEVEAYLLILSTWNFAGFRYILTNFDLEKFKQIIAEVNPVFERLKNERFEIANFDKLKNDITFIYNKLNSIVKQTGTSKIMYFKNPNLFVMWDTKIREMYKIPQIKTTAEMYIDFLKTMQKEFSHIKLKRDDISLARAVDMYNFVVTQQKIRSNNPKVKT